ncbi:MBL fold metallo-hydrolase [Fulvivirga ligni]|uniref:MBL fold metallo-hydrolase n=1 Tax=Fulvivirga ligni TaxID=2904246 RepID=UPI001F29B785|nr:MBL fold metallo-hydrolase [Fulvivirga ligni]UII19108.1 MBL fold metallo-hydrolase [Fulvivirga ligni]
MDKNLYFDASSKKLQSSDYGLYATPVSPLPYVDNVIVRSYLLERPDGNVIIYNSSGISQTSQELDQKGVSGGLFLNHHHEGMFGKPDIDISIWIHENDRPKVNMPITNTYGKEEKIGGDLTIVPTPGHTQGTTSFLWDNGEYRFLFPGDSIWVQNGQWKAVLLSDGDRSAYLDSLETMKKLDFDFIVPWGVEEGSPAGYAISKDQKIEIFDEIIKRLEAGENY